jgi:hypothetical protein
LWDRGETKMTKLADIKTIDDLENLCVFKCKNVDVCLMSEGDCPLYDIIKEHQNLKVEGEG